MMSVVPSNKEYPLSDPRDFLLPTEIIDSDNPRLIALAERITAGLDRPEDRAVALFEYVRDNIRYNPFSPFFLPEHYRPAFTLDREQGYCVQKAALLAGLARAAGIPARLLFADIRILRFEGRLRETMPTDVFTYHGYVELFVTDKWLQVTPSFELSLCERLGLKPVVFDGTTDAIFHKNDLAGRPHVVYLTHHGAYADVPVDEINAAWKRVYGEDKVTEWMAEFEA
jgi:transglutaminase-like putative cysteine protease